MDKKEILCRSQKENYIFDEFSYYVDKKAYANAYLAILIYSGIAALVFFLQFHFTGKAYSCLLYTSSDIAEMLSKRKETSSRVVAV